MPLTYIETNSTDPCYNLAFEEYILKNKTEGNWLMLWQNANTIVIGLNQNTAEEINAAFVKEHDITVVRRTTGGGAVYHDLGNLNYSFITDVGDKEKLSIKEFSCPVLRALSNLGLNAVLGGRNDISIDGKKVSGVAQRVFGSRILHHGTLLFESNAEMIAGALNVDPTKFQSKSAKSVRSRVGNIKDFLPYEMTLAEFWQALLDELSVDGAYLGTLTDCELAEISKNADEKYRTWDWTYGKNPNFSFSNKVRYAGGLLEVKLNTVNNVISDAAFSGDFMAVTDSADAAKSLCGVKLERAAVLSALEKVDIPSVFGGITLDEIVDTIFPVSEK